MQGHGPAFIGSLSEWIVRAVRNPANDRRKDETMADTSPPTNQVDTTSHRNRTALAIAIVTTALGATLFMSGLAHAEPMITTAAQLSQQGAGQQFGLADQRLLFGALTFGFSLLAAGVWHRSFRTMTRPQRQKGH